MKSPQKVSFGTETCDFLLEVGIWTCQDLPRPVQEDKSLSAKQASLFWFLENHAESSGHYLKNIALDLKRAKFDENSDFGHVRTCQGQSRRTSSC